MAQFLGPLPAGNYMLGRSGRSLRFGGASGPSSIVIHTMVGSIRSADAKFKNPASQLSAHYGVGLDGRIVQWVAESDTAYHTGNADLDLSSIGIEHEDGGNYDASRTDALYAASGGLVREICQRYGIPIARQWIIKHSEVPGAATRCPDALDIDRIVTMAEGKPNPAQPDAQPAAPGVTATPPPGPPPSTPPPAGQSQPIGEALREISANVYGDPSRWKDIYDAIKGVVADVPALGHLLAAPPPDQSLPQSDAVIPPSAQPPTPTKLWGGSQAAIFSLQIFYLTILAVLAIIYFTDRSLIDLPDSLGPLPVAVPWFGALGAVVISLVGTTEHRQDWDPTYRFWHWSRPLLGASFGSVSVLIFQAGILAVGSTPTANPASIPRNLLYYLVAFVVGYREETFRELVKRVTDIILSPGQTAAGPAAGSLAPQTGPAAGGTAVTLLGSGLSNIDTVRFGSVPAKFRIDGDSQITVTSPPGQAGASVAVTVAAKSTTAMAGTFTYT